MASLPVLSVWPTMTTWVVASRPWANWSSTGRRPGLRSARPVSNDRSLGTLTLSWLSAVRETSMPVPAVACSMARRLSSMRLDHRLPAIAPTAAPATAPVPALPPVALPMSAPATAPMAAPWAVPFSRSLMVSQPASDTATTATTAVRRSVGWSFTGLSSRETRMNRRSREPGGRARTCTGLQTIPPAGRATLTKHKLRPPIPRTWRDRDRRPHPCRATMAS